MEWIHCPGMTMDEVVRDVVTTFAIEQQWGDGILWALVDYRDQVRVIGFVLTYIENVGWCYSPVEEDHEPRYWDCPLRFLERAPVVCRRWRVAVLRYHQEKLRETECECVSCQVDAVMIRKRGERLERRSA